MNLIIRAAKIINPESSFHNKITDILLADGVIKQIGADIKNPDNIDELTLDNLHVSEGWFDSSVSFGEPGLEDRETIANGLSVAAKSGFTSIALQPNSYPIIDNQSQVIFARNKAHGFATKIYPIGALTKQSDGKDMAELFDMKNSGAIAFGDYNKNLDNPNLLKIALQYVQDFDGSVIAFSENREIKGSGVVNEGIVATRLGLKGNPALAEELQISRNLLILEYTGGRLHIPTISTAKSVELIKDAKAKGLSVTCSVSVHHLVLTDEVLDGFDTRFKVSPPLRTEYDRKALLKGVLDGTIDMITSDHNPIDIENKKVEFDMAKDGTIGLESAFGALMTILPVEVIVDKLTAGKRFFGIENCELKEGAVTDLTLFTPDGESIFTKENILSKSKNSAFLNTKSIGKVYGIVSQGQLVIK
ncbi:MAG TPA: dihydroorotase [Flavobacterium sp.]|jgi:dihydroorotase